MTFVVRFLADHWVPIVVGAVSSLIYSVGSDALRRRRTRRVRRP